MERVEEALPPPGRVMVVGFRDVVRPTGPDDAERETGPFRRFRLVTVTVEEPEITGESKRMLRLGGLKEMVKSGELVLKNSVIGFAFASFDARLGRFQFASIVLVKE